MFAKLMFLLVVSTVIAAGLLAMRQHRYEIANQMILRHREMDQTRRELWGLQTELPTPGRPQSLGEAVAKANLALEPVVPIDRPEAGKKNEALASGRSRRAGE